MDFENLAIVKAQQAHAYDRRAFLFSGGALVAALALAPIVGPSPAYADVPSGISLTVPGTLNFQVRGDGTLVGPSSEAFKIINNTDGVEIRVTSLKATASGGYTFVTDASSSQASNAVQVDIAANGNSVSLGNATGTNGAAPSDELAWTMSAPDMNADLSYLEMNATGSIANFDPEALRTQSTTGKIDWYFANDTLTDEIYERTKEFEDANEEFQTQVETLYALLTASGELPREVYAETPSGNTVAVDTTPALLYNESDTMLYIVTPE